VQPRIAAGSLAFAEIPAGMLDNDRNFKGKAIQEIREETGLEINSKDMRNMSSLVPNASSQLWKRSGGSTETNKPDEMLQKAMYPSPGGCDEFMPLFLCEMRLPRTKIEELRGKLTGEREEGEHITLKLVPFDRLWIEGARDGKTLAALALYENLKRAKLI
jgi:ADP-sugar diphosphatase